MVIPHSGYGFQRTLIIPTDNHLGNESYTGILKIYSSWSSHCGSAEMNPTSIHEASLSGLRTWHCHELRYRWQMQFGSVAVAHASGYRPNETTSLGISTYLRCGPKKTKKKKKKKKRKKNVIHFLSLKLNILRVIHIHLQNVDMQKERNRKY